MKNYQLLLISALLLFSVACSTNQEELEADISIPVSVMDVGKGSIEKYISTTGTVYPTNEVELKVDVSGDFYLQTNPRTGKPYKLGDYVEKGALIVKIEDREYENNLNISGKRLNLEISNQTLEKQRSLFEKGGVSQLDLKNSEVEAVNAQNSYDAAVISLSKMRITSPFSGVIVEFPNTSHGIRVEAGLTVMKIMEFNKLFLEVSFPEKQLPNIDIGQEVRITNYSIPDDTIFGKITALSPAIDPDTRTFKGSLILDNSEMKFRPGMFVKAELVLEKRDSVIVIPKNIIQSKQRGNTVFIVQRGAAQERVIQTGLENPDQVEVLEGLSENDRLVIKGFETLSNRSKVSIVQ